MPQVNNIALFDTDGTLADYAGGMNDELRLLPSPAQCSSYSAQHLAGGEARS